MNIRTYIGEFRSKNRQQYHEIGAWTLDHGIVIGDIGSESPVHGVGVGDIGTESLRVSFVVNTKDW